MLSSLAGKHVLVTGAGGFVGRHVLQQGRRLGVRLAALDRTAVELPDVQAIVADVADAEQMRKVCEAVRPEGIIHLAAAGVSYGSGSLPELLTVNAGGQAAVLEAASALSPPPAVVCAGSGFEYGPKDGPLCETDPLRPWSGYGVSKAAASLAAALYAPRLPVTILRLFSVYGPGEQEPRLAPYVIAQARRGAPIELTEGRQRRDYAYVADVAEAFWRALAAPQPRGQLRVLHVASGRETTLREFVECLSEILQSHGYRCDLRFGARPYRPDELMCYTVDVTLLRQTLGWTPPTSLRDGLTQMVGGCA